MQMKRIIHIGLWILLGSLPACKKEFTEPVMSRVQFTFDWGKLPPEAQIGENMGIRFYAEDGQVYDLDGDTASFNGSLPVGTYQVLLRQKPMCRLSAGRQGWSVSPTGFFRRRWHVAK